MKCLRRKSCPIRIRTWRHWWNNGRNSNGEACGGAARTIPAIAAHVRARLARQISDQHVGPGGYIPLIALSPDWEAAFADALVGSFFQLSGSGLHTNDLLVLGAWGVAGVVLGVRFFQWEPRT